MPSLTTTTALVCSAAYGPHGSQHVPPWRGSWQAHCVCVHTTGCYAQVASSLPRPQGWAVALGLGQTRSMFSSLCELSLSLSSRSAHPSSPPQVIAWFLGRLHGWTLEEPMLCPTTLGLGGQAPFASRQAPLQGRRRGAARSSPILLRDALEDHRPGCTYGPVLYGARSPRACLDCASGPGPSRTRALKLSPRGAREQLPRSQPRAAMWPHRRQVAPAHSAGGGGRCQVSQTGAPNRQAAANRPVRIAAAAHLVHVRNRNLSRTRTRNRHVYAWSCRSAVVQRLLYMQL